MRIRIAQDDGSEIVYEFVREFALCGMRMNGPMNPEHFLRWAGTTGYLRGQIADMDRRMASKERTEHPNGEGDRSDA